MPRVSSESLRLENRVSRRTQGRPLTGARGPAAVLPGSRERELAASRGYVGTVYERM